MMRTGRDGADWTGLDWTGAARRRRPNWRGGHSSSRRRRCRAGPRAARRGRARSCRVCSVSACRAARTAPSIAQLRRAARLQSVARARRRRGAAALRSGAQSGAFSLREMWWRLKTDREQVLDALPAVGSRTAPGHPAVLRRRGPAAAGAAISGPSRCPHRNQGGTGAGERRRRRRPRPGLPPGLDCTVAAGSAQPGAAYQTQTSDQTRPLASWPIPGTTRPSRPARTPGRRRPLSSSSPPVGAWLPGAGASGLKHQPWK